MLSLKTMKGMASGEGGMALIRHLRAGKASSTAAMSKAPDDKSLRSESSRAATLELKTGSYSLKCVDARRGRSCYCESPEC